MDELLQALMARSVVRRPTGMREEGNLDLTRRPKVPNPDGSHSTIRSMSIGVPEGEALIPSVREDGWYMSPDQAVRHFQNSGRHLGIFETPDSASAYARWLSSRQGRR